MDNTKVKIFSAMAIFGTTGFFMRYIAMPATAVAFFSGLIGIITLFAAMKLTNRKFRWRHVKELLPTLLLSGGALGGSWLFLIHSDRYVPNGLATVVYYIAPLVLMLTAPKFAEKLNRKKLIWGGVALVGIVLTTKFWESGKSFNAGVLLALGAAVLYGVVFLCNKNLPDMYSYDKTIIQLGTAMVIMLLYCLFTGSFTIGEIGSRGVVSIMVLGVVHMGLAHRMYFDGIIRSKIHSAAMFSYVNPAVTIFMSIFILGEKVGVTELLGVVLILIGIMASELMGEKIGRLFAKKG